MSTKRRRKAKEVLAASPFGGVSPAMQRRINALEKRKKLGLSSKELRPHASSATRGKKPGPLARLSIVVSPAGSSTDKTN